MRVILPLLVLFSITQVVPPETRFSKNVAILMDVSGSMDGSVEESVKAFRLITQQPTDDMSLAVVAFASDTAYWDWHKLPDDTALKDAEAWLSKSRSRIGHGTEILKALYRGLRLEKKDLTIVLVTDGQYFTIKDEDILATIASLQKERERKGLGKAAICCVGIGPEDESLVKIAKAGKGGYFRWTQ